MILARMQGIQNILMNRLGNGMFKLENKLKTELDEVLYQEVLLLFQKSHEEWIASGDRNTKFYHASIVVRRSQNNYGSIKMMSM